MSSAFEFSRNTQSCQCLAFLYSLYLKLSKIDKSVTSISIQSTMGNVNLHWNWWFSFKLFPIYLHQKLYKYANFVNFVHYAKTRLDLWPVATWSDLLVDILLSQTGHVKFCKLILGPPLNKSQICFQTSQLRNKTGLKWYSKKHKILITNCFSDITFNLGLKFEYSHLKLSFTGPDGSSTSPDYLELTLR